MGAAAQKKNQVAELLRDQVLEAQEKYPELELVADPEKGLIVHGRVGFTTPWQGETIEDDYQIELHAFDSYPSVPPRVFEVGGRIGKDFGHFMADGSLCLGAPVEVRYRFAKHPYILSFIDKQVVPYLFSYSYKLVHGTVPYGERAHSSLGIVEFYCEFFDVGDFAALKLIKLLADGFAPPASSCPCGSKLQLRNCHGPRLEELRPHSDPQAFAREIISIIEDGKRLGRRFPKRRVLPEVVRRRLHQRR